MRLKDWHARINELRVAGVVVPLTPVDITGLGFIRHYSRFLHKRRKSLDQPSHYVRAKVKSKAPTHGFGDEVPIWFAPVVSKHGKVTEVKLFGYHRAIGKARRAAGIYRVRRVPVPQKPITPSQFFLLAGKIARNEVKFDT